MIIPVVELKFSQTAGRSDIWCIVSLTEVDIIYYLTMSSEDIKMTSPNMLHQTVGQTSLYFWLTPILHVIACVEETYQEGLTERAGMGIRQRGLE